MSKAESALDFSVLLNRVLGCWPESISVAHLLENGSPNLYGVSGLTNVGDSIAEMLEKEADAVLLTGLCDAITSTIRAAAQFSTESKPQLLRPSALRENFDKRLQRAATNSDLGWTEADILLINRYFAVNTGTSDV